VVTCLLHREKGLDVWEGIFIALETRESKQLRLAEAESTTNTNLTRGSRLAAVQCRARVFFFPEIPLAAVHEIPSPNRSPTKLGAGKTVRPYCYNSVLCLHEAAPLRAARRKKKSRFPFALCSPGNSVAVDGSRKDQIRRRRSTARSDLPPVRTALLGPRHAVVPGAVGQRLQITGLREVRSLARFG